MRIVVAPLALVDGSICPLTDADTRTHAILKRAFINIPVFVVHQAVISISIELLTVTLVLTPGELTRLDQLFNAVSGEGKPSFGYLGTDERWNEVIIDVLS